MKRILIAPDSFKGTLDSLAVCKTIEKELASDFECVLLPMADGGEGTVDAIVNSKNGRIINVNASNHQNETIVASYGFFNDTAVIEAASVCGLKLIEEEKRNLLRSNSYGLGELILDALNNGAKNVLLAIGGTGTNDGGYGIGMALGYRFLDSNGEELPPYPEALIDLKSIIPPKNEKLKKTNFTVACDVKNPLCGENGASAVYGAQKGGTKEQLEFLDKCLENLADIIEKDLNIDVLTLEGGGAGGGISAGLVAFCGAKLLRGFDVVKDAVELEKAIDTVDAVITGEGKTDKQTLFGKLPLGVIESARKKGKPSVLISGRITNEGKTLPANAFFPCADDNISDEEAQENPEKYLSLAAKKAKEWLKIYI